MFYVKLGERQENLRRDHRAFSYIYIYIYTHSFSFESEFKRESRESFDNEVDDLDTLNSVF
jgi:hypothetical protein